MTVRQIPQRNRKATTQDHSPRHRPHSQPTDHDPTQAKDTTRRIDPGADRRHPAKPSPASNQALAPHAHAHAHAHARKGQDKPRPATSGPPPAPIGLASVRTSTHTRVPHDCRWLGGARVGVDIPPYPARGRRF
jgi:hypothetical protein